MRLRRLRPPHPDFASRSPTSPPEGEVKKGRALAAGHLSLGGEVAAKRRVRRPSER